MFNNNLGNLQNRCWCGPEPMPASHQYWSFPPSNSEKGDKTYI